MRVREGVIDARGPPSSYAYGLADRYESTKVCPQLRRIFLYPVLILVCMGALGLGGDMHCEGSGRLQERMSLNLQ